MTHFSPPLSHYRAPFWLPNRHSQTIIPALSIKNKKPIYRRERWTTPDDDFIDLDWINFTPKNNEAPLLVLFHGLEGSSNSHYARHILLAAQYYGWQAVVPHFRSCSGEINMAPRFYHSGDANEIDWILRRLKTSLMPDQKLFVIGVSLGGSALLHWLSQQNNAVNEIITAAAAISTPMDLNSSGHALAQGFNRFYTWHFLRTLKTKALQKLIQYPGLFNKDKLINARNLYEFDNVITAPLHGFKNTDDYWTRASAIKVLPNITAPTLILNAMNDPFIPKQSLPKKIDVPKNIKLLQPETGGHAGFSNAFKLQDITQHWLNIALFSFFDDYEN